MVRELPPRARRIPISAEHLMDYYGTTSACAENTIGGTPHCQYWGNYLRVRGEYSTPPSPPRSAWELPPRARRILVTSAIRQSQMGTTSACAENTLRSFPMDSQPGNYLRVRGEYVLVALTGGLVTELPPRARRIPWDCSGIWSGIGTTSACAENTVDGW